MDFDTLMRPLPDLVYNSLLRAGVGSLEKLLACSEKDLLRLPGIGPYKVSLIKIELMKHNMKLKD